MNLLKILVNNWGRLLDGELPYHLETRIWSTYNKYFNRRQTSAPFLSGDTYRSFADLEIKNVDDVLRMKDGDIVFLSSQNLKSFQYQIAPKIHTRFILITHHGDECVTTDYLGIANNPYLIHWFAQNNQLNHPKITAIPIGLEDAWRHNNGIVKDFISLRNEHQKKIPRILYGFNVRTNPIARSQALDVLRGIALADSIKVDSRRYRKILNQYMFVASPEGNGLDCHRTWEALYLQTIPIVLGRQFYGQFKQFPGLILDSWEELSFLNEDELTKIYHEKLAILTKTPYIWENYWRLIIDQKNFLSIK